MPPTTATNKPEKSLKGKEAEDRVIGYLKEMNRPFGAADISANIKSVVSKPAVQKILVAAAERGEVTQKAYGKVLLFVANQSNLEDMAPDRVQELTNEVDVLTESNKVLSAKSKSLTQDLNKIKSTPTNEDLATSLNSAREQVNIALAQLHPLRQGAPAVTQAELDQMEYNWKKYRAEWIIRKKIFREVWTTFTGDMAPSEVTELAEDLGVEWDSEEHVALEIRMGPNAMTTHRRKYTSHGYGN
ncbi:hypothetical protein FRC18_004633 [Serendipita sp. 400]|nr:hypothetical protein FRC18_004633 [Serendipita sp. 400]